MSAPSPEEARQHVVAAQRAEASTLWEDAVREYEAALSIVAAGNAPEEDEVALLTAAGSCYWNLAEARTAWRTLRRAIALAKDRGDGVAVARATVEILRIWGPPERHRALADDALSALGDADPYLRALLLLRRDRYDDDEAEGFAQAMALAEEHGFEDLLVIRTDNRGWAALEAGRIEEGVSAMETAHEAYARLHRYEPAAGTLRGAGFATMARGHLDRGTALATRAYEYARDVHFRFTEQLALMDLAGEAFARAEFDRCLGLVAASPGELDFRCDLYKMWIAELAGDRDGALRLLINPERGGGATTAVSQTHCANAGVLFHAGRIDAAQRQLDAWADAANQGNSICEELPPVFDCAVALGSHSLLARIQGALQRDAAQPAPTVFSTLQGRALAPARGAVAMKLGLVERAEAAFREGLHWCERERVPLDAAHCHAGLADVATVRGGRDAAAAHLGRAAEIFEQHGAKLWLDRLATSRR